MERESKSRKCKTRKVVREKVAGSQHQLAAVRLAAGEKRPLPGAVESTGIQVRLDGPMVKRNADKYLARRSGCRPTTG